MTSTAAPEPFAPQTNFARWTVGTAFLVTLFVAALIRSPLLFLMASTFMALSFIAYLVRYIGLGSIQYAFSPPLRVNQGELVHWTVRLGNRGRLPMIWLNVTVEPGDWSEFLDPPAAPLDFSLNPGVVMELSGTQRFELRGLRSAGTLVLSAQDPLGLVRVRRELALSPPLLVLPARIPFRVSRNWWGGRTVAESAGARPSRADGGEFHGTREYRPGDPLRRIHWKWTAHLNSFRVIEFADSLEREATILLDLNAQSHAGSGKESTLEYAVTLAASLAEALTKHGIHLRLRCAPDAWSELERGRGTSTLPALLNLLARVELIEEEDPRAVLYRYADSVSPDSSLLIISPAPPEQLMDLCVRLQRPGRMVRALWLDGQSFSDDPAGPVPEGGGVTCVRRGDNLARVMESLP